MKKLNVFLGMLLMLVLALGCGESDESEFESEFEADVVDFPDSYAIDANTAYAIAVSSGVEPLQVIYVDMVPQDLDLDGMWESGWAIVEEIDGNLLTTWIDPWNGEILGVIADSESTEPSIDGNFSNILGCGGNYGTVLGYFITQGSSIPAISNGDCTGTSTGTYQCVEFVDRVHPVTDGHSGAANTYDDGTNPRRMNMMFFTNQNGTYSPLWGDIVVSNGGSNGHVGVLSSLGSSSATIMDQNWSSSSATHAVTRSGTSLGNMSSSYPISGWLRHGWNFANDIDTTASIHGWSIRNVSITSVDSISVTLNPSSDPGVISPGNLRLDPTLYKKVKIRMKSKAPDGNVRVYFVTSNSPSWTSKQSGATTVSTNNTWQTVTVNFNSNGYWVYGGKVNQIRVDPADNGNSGSSDLISLDAVWFEPY